MAAAQQYSADSTHTAHDEAVPGTGPRVIPVDGSTDRPGSGWLRRRVALPCGGGSLSLPSPNLTNEERPTSSTG